MKAILAVGIRHDGDTTPVIGFKDSGSLPWSRPDDLKWYKANTYGCTCLIGKRSYEALPEVAKKGREYIVWDGTDLGRSIIFRDLRIGKYKIDWIVGGAHTIKMFKDQIDKYYLTVIDYSHDWDSIGTDDRENLVLLDLKDLENFKLVSDIELSTPDVWYLHSDRLQISVRK